MSEQSVPKTEKQSNIFDVMVSAIEAARDVRKAGPIAGSNHGDTARLWNDAGDFLRTVFKDSSIDICAAVAAKDAEIERLNDEHQDLADSVIESGRSSTTAIQVLRAAIGAEQEESVMQAATRVMAQLAEARKVIERLEAALKQYADEKNWDDNCPVTLGGSEDSTAHTYGGAMTMWCGSTLDEQHGWAIARAALAASPNDGGKAGG